ncbi:MAG: hypothetical protein M1817_001374 [Caeruleum heppii]|nr:MAG: hypothetical protein M1817_001374 [Caeruleum heppii]
MAASPTTPTSGDESLTGEIPVVLKTTQTSMMEFPHDDNHLEPSPASTYGGTSVGESVPATPLDIKENNRVRAVRQRSTTKSLDLTPQLRLSRHYIQESPSDNPKSDSHYTSTYREHAASKSEPELLTSMKYNPISEEDSPPTQCGRPQWASSVSSSPSASGRLVDPNEATKSESHLSSFVLRGLELTADDPFVSPSRGRQLVRETSSPTGRPRIQSSPGHAASPIRRDFGYANHQAIPFGPSARVEEQVGQTLAETPSPRADHEGEPISKDNAQAILPPSACVFVANLASVKTDEHLERSVSQVFCQFGTVYVKIRRDNRGMPYAFCQFENDDNAREAVVRGRQIVIDGRPCRTEPAKANRSLYLSRLTGGPVSEEAARDILRNHGAIDSCWWSSRTERELYHLPEGIWVKFAYFQDCRDALSALREDTQYRVEQPATTPEQRGPHDRQSPLTRPNWTPRIITRTNNTHDNSFMREVDRRSVYVGNLPEGITREEVIQEFSQYGKVMLAELIAKAAPFGLGYKTFAFVEFGTMEEANEAIHGHNHKMLKGMRLRVQRKVTYDSGSRRARSQASRFPPRNLVQVMTQQIRTANAHIEAQRQALVQMVQNNVVSGSPSLTASPEGAFPGQQGYHSPVAGPVFGSPFTPLPPGRSSGFFHHGHGHDGGARHSYPLANDGVNAFVSHPQAAAAGSYPYPYGPVGIHQYPVYYGPNNEDSTSQYGSNGNVVPRIQEPMPTGTSRRSGGSPAAL